MPRLSLSKLFSPPKFLERPTVSLEIRSNGIFYWYPKKDNGNLYPDLFGLVPLPAGAVIKGEIVKRELVLRALVDIRRKTGARFVRFSVPEEKTYFFRQRLPKLSPKEINDILEFKIEENVPLATKEAVFGYDKLPQSPGRDEISIVVSVAPLDWISDWQDVFRSVDLMPLVFSPESNNVARSVIKDGNEQTIVVVNIKENNIILSLAVSGLVVQTSNLGFGGSTFDELLAKYFQVSIEQAEEVKREKLFKENQDSMEIFSFLINTISAIKDEIYKFITYCNGQEGIPRVDRVILCGLDSQIVGLDKYLALNLGLNVETANVWVNNFELNEYVPGLNQTEALDLAAVNGLSLIR